MCVIAVRCRTSNVTFPTRGPVDDHTVPIIYIGFTFSLGDASSGTPVVTIAMGERGIIWLVVGNDERVFLCRNQLYSPGHGCDH